MATTAVEQSAQYLTFRLGEEVFALDIVQVREVLDYTAITRVPRMPEFMRGVINLRGSVVPVVDLSARFGRKSTALTRRTCIVIIEVVSDQEKQVVGVVVDAVNEVLEIPQEQIEPPPAFGAKIRTDFIRGMGKVASKFVIILNVGNVLSIDDLALLEQANAQGMESANEGAVG
jgi:purine-binding chemotaxis protein CheW